MGCTCRHSLWHKAPFLWALSDTSLLSNSETSENELLPTVWHLVGEFSFWSESMLSISNSHLRDWSILTTALRPLTTACKMIFSFDCLHYPGTNIRKSCNGSKWQLEQFRGRFCAGWSGLNDLSLLLQKTPFNLVLLYPCYSKSRTLTMTRSITCTAMKILLKLLNPSLNNRARLGFKYLEQDWSVCHNPSIILHLLALP